LAFAGASGASELTAREIIEKATSVAGGDAWRYARSIRLTGEARLYRRSPQGVLADDYEMNRIFPVRLEDADTATGKFRLDARMQGRMLFQTSFDGEYMYDRNGRIAQPEGERRAAAAFGFSAIRFALDDDFRLEKLADDQIDGHPAHFVRVVDPSGGVTLFAIDSEDFAIRMVAWDTPQGWHHRVYSDFYWVEDPGFRQPGRVRLYYDGVKSVDIRWTNAEINVELDDELFRLGDDR
jgi:hypothetical protein